MDGFVSGSGPFTTSLVLGNAAEIAGRDGSSRELTNALDLELLKSLRRRAALIQTSVKTANAENYRMPKGKLLALFANSTQVHAPNLLLGDDRPLFFGDAIQPEEYTAGVTAQSLNPNYHELVERLALADRTIIHSEFGLKGLELTASQLSCVYLSTRGSAALTDILSRYLLATHMSTAEISISDLTVNRLDTFRGVASQQERDS